ncbi:TetR/AcrR family transcriptional regulator [Streptomyces sp. M10(2022)]
MVRLNRVQQQERTLAAVLAAAKAEFTAHGYTEAKVDRIAERAELTRGAVYSNFPSKRALYLATLVDMVEHGATEGVRPQVGPRSTGEALASFARVWLERLPLSDDTPAFGRLRLRSLTGVLNEEAGRTALAQVTRLETLLLALALESIAPGDTVPARQVRRAELVLTMLNGSAQLADTAHGFGDPFDVAHACEHLAGLGLADTWDPPHLPYVGPAQPCRSHGPRRRSCGTGSPGARRDSTGTV